MNWWIHLTCSHAMLVILALMFAVAFTISAFRKRRRRGLAVIRRSPFFRQVHNYRTFR